MMYQAYLAEISITQDAAANAIQDRVFNRRALPSGISSPRVMCSSYHTPNHQTNENANSGDLVSEIVANTANGQTRKNRRITNRWSAPAGRASPVSCSASIRSPPSAGRRNGRLKNRLAVAAQQNAANTNWIADSATNPASFEPVRYRETAVAAP